MANREIYPGGIYPLTGDVQSQAGNTGVRVVGLQGIAIADDFVENGDALIYQSDTHNWVPTPINSTIQVNGVPVSDDPFISVNVAKPILVNGS